MSITHRHAQDALMEREEARIARGVTFRQQIQAQIARGGSPLSDVGTGNGYYDEDGVFTSYLRLDVDNFDSGRGCAR